MSTGGVASPGNRKALGLIFVVVVLDLMGAGILVPVIPFVVREFRSDATTIGWLAVSFSAAQFLSSPILGVLSDRFGRRPVLLLSILGSSLGYFLFAVGGALWVLFVARIRDGVTGGNISTAQSFIADVTAPHERAKNFGLIGAAFGLGFIAGPALGGLLSHWSLAAPAYAAGLMTLATAVAGYFILPESLPAERRRKEPIAYQELNPFRMVVSGFRRDSVRGLLAAVFLLNFGFSGLQSNFVYFTFQRFGLGPRENAVLFVYLGVLAAFFQGYVIRRWMSRYGEPRLAVWGLVGAGVGFAVTALVEQAWMLYPAITILALGNSLATPSLTGMVSQRVGGGEQGLVLGITQSVAAVTRVLGPVWAGWAFDRFGSGAPYWSAAVLLAPAVAVMLRDRRRGKEGHSGGARAGIPEN